MSTNKQRICFALACVLTIAAGLGSRKFGDLIPGFIAAYAGDTLYATNIYFGLRFLKPQLKPLYPALACYLFCVVIELSQLYHGPTIDAVRDTLFGQLVLGSGFLWSDLVCYGVGTLLGLSLEQALRRALVE